MMTDRITPKATPSQTGRGVRRHAVRRHGVRRTASRLPALVLGMMSGTSLDGIDCAYLRTDGEAMLEQGAHATYPYDGKTRRLLRTVLTEAQGWDGRGEPPADVARVARRVTRCHVEAARAFMRSKRGAPKLIGFHGQTILHRPRARLTVQIGNAQALAQELGIPVAAQFRETDVAAGGEGAPLAPLYHQALARTRRVRYPLCVLNIGGVANVTFLREKSLPLAFDVGPGNALLDDWVRQHSPRRNYDENGALASQGVCDEALLKKWCAQAWFAKRPPKSLDRLETLTPGLATLSLEDGAATLTEFTAAGVALAEQHLPAEASQLRWVVCGGGQHNRSLMRALERRLAGKMRGAKKIGWPGDEMEAQAFAYLAVRVLRGLPLSLPDTTGVSEPLPGGQMHYPLA